MRYMLRQKILTLKDDFRIRDVNGTDVFRVDGQFFSIGKKLRVYDASGQERAFIKQRLFRLAPTYEIYRDGALMAVVRKKLFTFLRSTFTIDLPNGQPMTVTGNLLSHEYTFNRAGRNVAQVSKEWFTLADTYGVDVADGEDDVLILSVAVVIDMACHNGQRGGISLSMGGGS
jgi:uncharacterized protein YxjI